VRTPSIRFMSLPSFRAPHESAPSLAPAVPPAPEGVAPPSAPRGGRPGWVLPVIAGTVVLGLLLALGIVAGTVLVALRIERGDGAYVMDPSDDGQVGGVVTDSSGTVVDDGTGGYDRPGTVGEHTVAWGTWDGGTMSVGLDSAEVGGTIPGHEDLPRPGFTLVSVEGTVAYDGPGSLVLTDELWLGAETDLVYVDDMSPGVVQGSLGELPPLEDGGTVAFTAVFVVPAGEEDGVIIDASSGEGDFSWELP